MRIKKIENLLLSKSGRILLESLCLENLTLKQELLKTTISVKNYVLEKYKDNLSEYLTFKRELSVNAIASLLLNLYLEGKLTIPMEYQGLFKNDDEK